MSSFDVDAYFQHTPLHSAAWRCKKDEVQQFVEAGEDINARDTWGHTPLHRVAEPYPHCQATAEQQIEAGKILLDAGATVNAKDNERATPLHLAALCGREQMVRLLLEHGSEVDAHTDNGWTPLHSAVVCGHSDVVQLLLASGANVNDAEAEFGGEESLMPTMPKRKYTPLGLLIASSDARLQAVADLLRQYGGK